MNVKEPLVKIVDENMKIDENEQNVWWIRKINIMYTIDKER